MELMSLGLKRILKLSQYDVKNSKFVIKRTEYSCWIFINLSMYNRLDCEYCGINDSCQKCIDQAGVMKINK